MRPPCRLLARGQCLHRSGRAGFANDVSHDLCEGLLVTRRRTCGGYAGLSLLHVACTARIACKWVRESRLCSQNTTLPPYARRVRKPSPLIVRQGSRRLASRNVSRRPSEVEPSPERVRWPRMSLFPQIATVVGWCTTTRAA